MPAGSSHASSSKQRPVMIGTKLQRRINFVTGFFLEFRESCVVNLAWAKRELPSVAALLLSTHVEDLGAYIRSLLGRRYCATMDAISLA
jgi:hypothetical protein